MKIPGKTIFFAPVVIAVVAAFWSYTPPDNPKKDAILMQVIMQGMNARHYDPQIIDDDFSMKAFDLYLERLDRMKIFLTQDDVSKLREYKTRIDDEVRNNSYNFFDMSQQLITKRIERAEKLFEASIKKPFDFNKSENIQLDYDDLPYASDEKQLKEYWRKSLKYQTLVRIHTALNKQEQDESEGKETKNLEELEKEARSQVKKSQEDYFRRMKQLERSDWKSMYINAMLGTYDPHTSYLPPKDKANFDISMSGQLEGIGATLQEKDSYIKVVRIVPGSPSWKQGDLKSNDLILKVAQGDEEPVDVVGMRLDEAVQMIRGKKGTEVRLTVKKPDGEITVVPIVRDVVILEETYAKSTVIEDRETNTKAGYIYLPSFYANFQDRNGRHASSDVAAEVEKLRKENIDGIVLDLRNNGGGSLQDVVDMVGLFIETGPVVQVKAREGEPYVMPDRDPQVQYDGPLIVLVNHLSASASEILAAAIQDYNRGVIIGGTSTFGKGTVQRLLDLDDAVMPSLNDIKPLGTIKLTTQKFYRINGGATQLRGVVPDINLPDVYDHLDVGEKDQEYPMKWDEIAEASHKDWKANIDIDKLRKKSEKRVSRNDAFQLINENALRLKEQREQSMYSLNIEQYRERQKRLKQENKKYEDIKKEIEELAVYTLSQDQVAPSDTVALARQKDFKEDIKEDVYVYEALKVLQDMK